MEWVHAPVSARDCVTVGVMKLLSSCRCLSAWLEVMVASSDAASFLCGDVEDSIAAARSCAAVPVSM